MVKSNHQSSDDFDLCPKLSHSLAELPSEEEDWILGEDQISNLPQPLRHHILSKLSSEDAMQTMVLSKAWKDEWLTSPCLDLDNNMADRSPGDTQLKYKFLDFAFRTLIRRNDLNYSSIETLHLFLPAPPETIGTCSANLADILLCFAVTKFVIQELKLSSYFMSPQYELPKHIIQYAHYLTSLELRGLKFDQQTIAILAVNCPLLKSLELRFCDFIDLVIRVSGFHKLDNLSVITTTSKEHDVKVEIIDAPSLVKFRYSGLSASRVESSSITVISDSSCVGLKCMDLTDVRFDRNSLNWVLSRLPNLQKLNLSCAFLCNQRLDICSPSLKHLVLRLQNLLDQLHIDVPNLTDFVYNFRGWDAIPIIFPYNVDSFNPEMIIINIESTSTNLENLVQCVQLSRFLRQLDGFSRHLMARISIYFRESLSCFEGLHSSVYCFEHVVLTFNLLNIHVWSPEPVTSQVVFTNLLDPALCLFPNLQSCIILLFNSEMELVKFKLEFKYKGSEVQDCWQQRLDEVRIENIYRAEMYVSYFNTRFEEAIKANKMVVQC